MQDFTLDLQAALQDVRNAEMGIHQRNIGSGELRRIGWAFPQSAFAETLGFCAVFVGPLLENPMTDTTFLLRSPKTEKEQSLTH